MIKRILNISHNDFDGIAAAIAVKARHHPFEHVVTKFANHDSVHDVLYRALTQKRSPYQRIVLSDIAFKVPGSVREDATNHLKMLVNYYLPEAIQAFVACGGELVVLDHHPGCLEVMKVYRQYLHSESICRLVDAKGDKRAGSELAGLYHAAGNLKGSSFSRYLYDICKIAGDYDTFRDVSGQVGYIARGIELMNDCQQAMTDIWATIDTFVLTSRHEWENMNGLLGQYMLEADKMYQGSLSSSLSTLVDHSVYVSEVYAQNFSDFVATEVYEMNKGVVIVRYDEDRSGVDRLSLRRHRDFPIDLGVFAKRYGGGGHAVAAGMPVEKNALNSVVNALVKECAAISV